MTIHAPSRKLTYQDLQRLPDDLLRHELIDGEHYVNPAPALKHQIVVVNLVRVLAQFVDDRQLGWILCAPFDVLFSDFDVVEPDILFLSNERAERIGERYIAGAPDLVIEVLSPSTRRVDRGAKRRLYERYGVREYWLVNPVAESVEVDRAGADGRFERLPALSNAAGDTLESPLFPGLRIPLSTVFRQRQPR